MKVLVEVDGSDQKHKELKDAMQRWERVDLEREKAADALRGEIEKLKAEKEIGGNKATDIVIGND